MSWVTGVERLCGVGRGGGQFTIKSCDVSKESVRINLTSFSNGSTVGKRKVSRLFEHSMIKRIHDKRGEFDRTV